jgi:hypothetical protein
MQEDKPPTRRSYSDAEAAADLATYYTLKKSVSVRSLVLVALLCLVLIHWFPVPGLALVAGGVCGVLNTLLIMRGGERMIEGGTKGSFVFSSFLRILVFGIVPVAFAVLGPWWSMAFYFAGFFLPLVMFAVEAHRRFR